jgi:phosphoglucomutase
MYVEELNTQGVRLTDRHQGLSAYVLNNVPNAVARGIIIGHDHRHNSENWAVLTAAVFLEHGFKVYLFSGNVPTPLQVL